MTRILLTGAGFSRNWGGLLASDAFEYLLGCNEIDDQTRVMKFFSQFAANANFVVLIRWRGMVKFKRSSEQPKVMSRLTKPSVIFRERVVPAYANYLNHPLSEYHANNLAEALNNTVEWTYLYLDEVDRTRLSGATLASFRTGLLTEHRALHVMSDLADAAQHRELTFERKPPRVVTLSTDAYYEKEGVLFVKHFDTPFPSAAKQAFEFWRDWPD